METEWISRGVYIVATVLFVMGLKRLGHPGTARGGNRMAAVAMGVAIAVTIIVTLIEPGMTYYWIVAGGIIGSVIGFIMAKRVQMTEMPQLVALFNGFGGVASTFVGLGDFWNKAIDGGQRVDADYGLTIGLSVLIGTVTFSGSLIAFGKLQGIVTSAPANWPGKFITSFLVAAATLGALGWLVWDPTTYVPILALVVGALLLGVMLVMPIGGADMPVVVALLNAYSGMAASATGFVLGNEVLIVAGALVGASGLILTKVMCEAMNRSLANVIFGAFGAADGASGGDTGAIGGKEMRATSVDDVAIQLAYAEKVVFVPGYGMAMAQAQHAVRELSDLLGAQGVDVKFAIHPVAGRMPGHMNVLLAEANVPYSQLYELDQINADLKSTDVSVIIGANDVVNPDARDNPSSEIYGMPIIEVDQGRSVIVMKRGRGRGFAGIENPLFVADRTQMLFGDAKDSLMALTQAVKAL